MTDDPWNDPETLAWMRHVIDDLGPKIEKSACTISIVPKGGTDVKFAVELGMSIMYDKPIILAVFPGAQIPDHLRRVADEIVEVDGTSASNQRRITEAVSRVMRGV